MRIISLVASLAFVFSVSAANAQQWYGGVSGKVSTLQDADNSGGGISIKSEFETGFGLSSQVGVAFGGIRVEGELLWSTNDADKLVVTNDGGIGVALGVGSLNGLTLDADGEVNALALMANGYYDFPTGGPWVPYVGVGLGYARVSADIRASRVKLVDDSDTVFAYQAMVGVGYAVGPSTRVFGGYRYFGTQDPSLKDTVGASFDSEFGTNNFEVGVRFGF